VYKSIYSLTVSTEQHKKCCSAWAAVLKSFRA